MNNDLSLTSKIFPNTFRLEPFDVFIAKNPHLIVNYFNNKDKVLPGLPTLFQFYVERSINKQMLVDVLSLPCGASHQPLIFDPEIFKVTVQQLMIIDAQDATLARSLLMITNANNDSALNRSDNFAEAVPLLMLKAKMIQNLSKLC